MKLDPCSQPAAALFVCRGVRENRAGAEEIQLARRRFEKIRPPVRHCESSKRRLKNGL
jgi:hypothetical protein